MRVKEQKAMWQSNSMGAFDGLKLKLNNFIIDQTINYLGHNFSKQKRNCCLQQFRSNSQIKLFSICF